MNSRCVVPASPGNAVTMTTIKLLRLCFVLFNWRISFLLMPRWAEWIAGRLSKETSGQRMLIKGRIAVSNTRFLGLTRVSPPNGISIGSTVFAGLTNVTNRHTDTPHTHTDRPRCSVCNNRPLSLTNAAVRPKNW